MTSQNWKAVLGDQIPDERGREIETFAGQVELRKQNKVDEKVFAETRLRWGIYGQRYDNGQRYDGTKTQTLTYPSGDLTKGPNTFWDAPGMLRIKIPFGGVTPQQMEALAEVADEYSDGILHVTTRQDFQLHFVHIEDTPDLMRRLAAVGITTRKPAATPCETSRPARWRACAMTRRLTSPRIPKRWPISCWVTATRRILDANSKPLRIHDSTAKRPLHREARKERKDS